MRVPIVQNKIDRQRVAQAATIEAKREAAKAKIKVCFEDPATEEDTFEELVRTPLEKLTAALDARTNAAPDDLMQRLAHEIAVTPYHAMAARPNPRKMQPVLAQLQKAFIADDKATFGVDDSAHVARARDAGSLRREGQVMWLSYGSHGVLYARSNRLNNGKPILGRIYSGFLFDAYRRPYTFKGGEKAIAQGWRQRLIESREAAVQPHIDNIVCEGSKAVGPEAIAAHIADLSRLRERLIEATTRSQHLTDVANKLRSVLKAHKGIRYPAVDFFLHKVSGDLASVFKDDPNANDCAMAVVQDCWGDLTKANGVGGLDKREIWPIADSESWRINDDQLWALAMDNLHFTGSPTTYDRAQVSPDMKAAPPRTAREEQIVALLDRQLRKIQTVMPQQVSHEAIRDAVREFHLAKMFFDERLQRNTAVDARLVASLPEMTEPQKRQALTRADGMQLTPIANVPWRVTTDEAQTIVDRFFVMYKTLPVLKFWNAKRANCNSIDAAIMARAVEIDASRGRIAQIHLPKGKRARVGAYHDIALPRGRQRKE